MKKILTATMDKEEAIFALGQSVPVVFYITNCCRATSERHGGNYHRLYDFAGESNSKVLVTTDCDLGDLEIREAGARNTSSRPYELSNGCFVYDSFPIGPGYINDDCWLGFFSRAVTEAEIRNDPRNERYIGLARFLDEMRRVQTGEQAAQALRKHIALRFEFTQEQEYFQRLGLDDLLNTITF